MDMPRLIKFLVVLVVIALLWKLFLGGRTEIEYEPTA